MNLNPDQQTAHQLHDMTLTSSRDSSFKLCSSFLSTSCCRNISQKLKLQKTCSTHFIISTKNIQFADSMQSFVHSNQAECLVSSLNDDYFEKLLQVELLFNTVKMKLLMMGLQDQNRAVPSNTVVTFHSHIFKWADIMSRSETVVLRQLKGFHCFITFHQNLTLQYCVRCQWQFNVVNL